MRTSFILTVYLLALAVCSVTAAAQTRTFTNADRGYALDLPSSAWDVVQRPDGVHRHMEFVHSGGGDWHLRVRREMVDRGVTTAALADEEESE